MLFMKSLAGDHIMYETREVMVRMMISIMVIMNTEGMIRDYHDLPQTE
jgi:hypothetical protein